MPLCTIIVLACNGNSSGEDVRFKFCFFLHKSILAAVLITSYASFLSNLIPYTFQMTLMGSSRTLDDHGDPSSSSSPLRPVDMTLAEQRAWEQAEMLKPVDFAQVRFVVAQP